MEYKTYKMEDALEYIIDYRGRTPVKSESGIPTLSAKSVRDGYIDYSQCYYISEDEYRRFMVRGFPQIGDVLLTTEAPLGNTARLDREDVAIAQRLITLHGKEGVLETGYLYYYLKSAKGQGKLREKQTGTTVLGIKQEEFRKIEIEIPSIDEQRRILAYLEPLDAAIATNKEINENLLQQARATYRHYLEEASPNTYHLLDIAEINPEVYSPTEAWDYVNYLDTSSITSGVINEIQYIRPSVDKLPSRARRVLKQGDIVFSTVRPNQLHYGIISNPMPNMLGSTGFAVVRSKSSNIPNEIIYLALTEPSFIAQMQKLAEQSVSTFPSIKPTDLNACIVPEILEEKTHIAQGIVSLFQAISVNSEEIVRFSAMRDTLLRQLMFVN